MTLHAAALGEREKKGGSTKGDELLIMKRGEKGKRPFICGVVAYLRRRIARTPSAGKEEGMSFGFTRPHLQ